jgi:CheY-like chemotaxis protein
MANEKLTRIFVVDDEPIIGQTLATILEKNGFSAKSFVDPLAALFASESDVPDLLISDVMMPRLSGPELAIRIKERCPACKVLLFSGQAATADLLRTTREQGHDFELLMKPVHPKDLLLKIHESTLAVA